MTVPKNFRKGAQIPEALILHYEDVDNEDIKTVNGVPMTKPLKTIIDLIEEERVSLDLIEQAVKEGLSRGLFTRQDIKRKKLSAKAKNVFAEILFEIAA